MTATTATERAPTQEAQVLELLRERGPEGVTPLLALERCRCMRLAAVVHRLRGEGHVIDSELVRVESGKRVARYVLVQPATGWVQLGLTL